MLGTATAAPMSVLATAVDPSERSACTSAPPGWALLAASSTQLHFLTCCVQVEQTQLAHQPQRPAASIINGQTIPLPRSPSFSSFAQPLHRFITASLCILCLSFQFIHSFNPSPVCVSPHALVHFHVCVHVVGVRVRRLALRMIHSLLPGQRATRGKGGEERHDVASAQHTGTHMRALDEDKHVYL